MGTPLFVWDESQFPLMTGRKRNIHVLRVSQFQHPPNEIKFQQWPLLVYFYA